MNEEENKAIGDSKMTKEEVIDILNKCLFWFVGEKCEIGKDEIRKISKFIEDQQKEIEEKRIIIFAGAEKVKQLEKEIKDLKETNEDNAEKSLLNDIFIKKNYISKDKIREKMREIMGYTISSSEERHCQNYAYDRLKELLEEN